jgi:exodeoxyribonuclease-1
VVIGNLKVLAGADGTGGAAERWGIDLGRVERHAAAARALPDLRALWAQVFARPAQDHDVDEALYDGFVGDEDRRRLQRLRAAPQDADAARRTAFDDERLAELVFRWRARHAPHTLDADERARWAAHRSARLHHGAAGATTLAQFQQQIDELAEQAAERGDARAEALLEALVDWAAEIAPE